MPSAGIRHLHSLSTLEWLSCLTNALTPAETRRRRLQSLLQMICWIVSALQSAKEKIPYLQDLVRHVHGPQRRPGLIPDKHTASCKRRANLVKVTASQSISSRSCTTVAVRTCSSGSLPTQDQHKRRDPLSKRHHASLSFAEAVDVASLLLPPTPRQTERERAWCRWKLRPLP